MLVIITANGFIGASMGMIIFTSAIRSIPEHLFHAARVDGAGPLAITWHITLPAIRWPLSFITVYQTLPLLVSFEYIWLITDGGPFYDTMVYALYVYKRAFENGQYAYGAAQTILVLTMSTLAGYHLSRFQFAGRASFPQALLVLHAFPAMTLIIPIFLMMHWTGMLDTISGVILVLTILELPFAIFVMKGFFDAVPWGIEMSAMTDGASRRQAFFQVVLPQVRVGLPAVGVFAPLKDWKNYVFVRTLLFEKQNWTMNLYLFWVSDDIMGVDYGAVAAAAVLYVIPSLVLYLLCQKYLAQMTIDGVKG